MKRKKLIVHNIFRKSIGICFILCLMMSMLIEKTALAETPYKTYTIDGNGNVMETQTAYTPYQTITKIENETLKSPQDMKIKNSMVYIADTGNKRIVISDLKGKLLQIIKNDNFKSPTGLYVTDDSKIYVADKDAQAVFVLNEKGELLTQYGKPNHPLYGDDVTFKPQKLVVDQKGIMYIICEGNTNGVVQITPTDGGTFLGYFGTNPTSPSAIQVIQRLIMSEEQLSKIKSILPPTPNNLTIDSKGLIYTVTVNQSTEVLKKLNVAGKNLLQSINYVDLPSSVTVGNYENIYLATDEGFIFEFTKDGDFLFVFGAKDDGRLRTGLSDKIVAIEVDEKNCIYTLDSEKNQIQIYQPTEFTNLLHEALYLYQNGNYTKSKEPLEQILTMNSLFAYANMAMGQALLQEENYTLALKYFRLAQVENGYSDAFWEIRNLWLKENIITAAFTILAIYLGIKILKKVHKKTKCFQKIIDVKDKILSVRLMDQLSYTLYFIKHPIDGCYGIRRERKSSYLSANIILTIFTLVYIAYKYFTGFLFKMVPDGYYEIPTDIVYIVVIFALSVCCTYLVSTINEGEGTFQQLYCGLIYSLTPYLIFKPMILIISNVVTYNERFIVNFSNLFMYTWIGVLIFLTIKEINNYTIKETIKVIGLTLFCALIFVLLIFIMYVLVMQVWDFAEAIIGEVVYRFGA